MPTIEDFKKSILWCWNNRDKIDAKGMITIPKELSLSFGFHSELQVRADLNQAFHWLMRELSLVGTSSETSEETGQKRLPPPSATASPPVPYREPVQSQAAGGAEDSTGTQDAAVKVEEVIVEPFTAEPGYVPDFQVPNS